MKYKIGDKVKVKSKLKQGNYYGTMFFNDEMEAFRGKTLVIKDIYPSSRAYLTAGNIWKWTDEMFECLEKSNKFTSEVIFK